MIQQNHTCHNLAVIDLIGSSQLTKSVKSNISEIIDLIYKLIKIKMKIITKQFF